MEHIFTEVDPKSATEYAGGWHDIIEHVIRASDGMASVMDLEGYKRLEAGYAEKFGA